MERQIYFLLLVFGGLAGAFVWSVGFRDGSPKRFDEVADSNYAMARPKSELARFLLSDREIDRQVSFNTVDQAGGGLPRAGDGAGSKGVPLLQLAPGVSNAVLAAPKNAINSRGGGTPSAHLGPIPPLATDSARENLGRNNQGAQVDKTNSSLIPDHGSGEHGGPFRADSGIDSDFRRSPEANATDAKNKQDRLNFNSNPTSNNQNQDSVETVQNFLKKESLRSKLLADPIPSNFDAVFVAAQSGEISDSDFVSILFEQLSMGAQNRKLALAVLDRKKSVFILSSLMDQFVSSGSFSLGQMPVPASSVRPALVAYGSVEQVSLTTVALSEQISKGASSPNAAVKILIYMELLKNKLGGSRLSQISSSHINHAFSLIKAVSSMSAQQDSAAWKRANVYSEAILQDLEARMAHQAQ